MTSGSRAVLIATMVASSGCGANADLAGRPTGPRTSVAIGAGRPWLSVVEREGDPRGALAVAVTTEGIAPDRGATIAVALAALVEERLAARGIVEAGAVGGWNGWRLRTLVASPVDAARL